MARLTEWLARLFSARRLRLIPVPVRRAGVLAFLLLALANVSQAQIPDAQLKHMGLEAVWRAQLQMPVEEGQIVSTHLWSNPSEKRSFAELTLPPGTGGIALGGNRTLRASADQLDATGAPIGMEAAKRIVETRASRLLGRVAGIPAVEVTVPMIYMAVVTSDGFVQNFNAETGEKLWSNSCASLRFPAAPASVSDVGIVVAQGAHLYLFDWKTGKLLSKREMKRASSAGVALIDDVAFVSSLSGQLMAFEFGEPAWANRWSFRLYGRAVTRPAASGRTHKLVAFATENGVVTIVSAAEKIGPWFNFEARSPLAGPLTFIGGALYCGDTAGQVSKIGLDRIGHVEWRLMIGSSLNATPVVANKVAYLCNELGDLFAVDDQTGISRWAEPAPRVKAILAATGTRVYCRSLTDRLMVIDAASGKILTQTGDSLVGTTVVNQLDDRIYLITAGGTLQCLREGGKERALPTFHEPQIAPVEEKKPEVAGAVPAPATEAPAADVGGDPFGASDAPATPPATDPNDPFGTAAPAASADPFN